VKSQRPTGADIEDRRRQVVERLVDAQDRVAQVGRVPEVEGAVRLEAADERQVEDEVVRVRPRRRDLAARRSARNATARATSAAGPRRAAGSRALAGAGAGGAPVSLGRARSFAIAFFRGASVPEPRDSPVLAVELPARRRVYFDECRNMNGKPRRWRCCSGPSRARCGCGSSRRSGATAAWPRVGLDRRGLLRRRPLPAGRRVAPDGLAPPGGAARGGARRRAQGGDVPLPHAGRRGGRGAPALRRQRDRRGAASPRACPSGARDR